MRTQPNFGLRRFISTMAAMSCVEGPFGSGFRFRWEEENSRRYFRWTSALWNLNSVAGLIIADSFGMRCGLTKRVVIPSYKAIEHGEIRRTLSGAIADQELMFEQERYSYDLARAAQTEEFREGHEQMDRQEEQIAHEYYLAGQSAQDCTTAAIHAKFANSP